jgi:hypothetical protein
MFRRIHIPVFTLVFIIMVSMDAKAQKEVNMDSGPSFMDRVYTGGGFGFSSNSNQTTISLSPLAGYMITRKLSAGLGITYQYYNNSFYNADDHRYGGRVFVMQMLIYNFFLYGEYNFINLNPQPWLESIPRETYTRAMLGGGFSQPLGRASLNVMAAYDLTHNNTSPYASPWVIGAFISI